ncbi:MAG: hypothetical protein A2Y10_16515 [Planctomycetes bacterium GWF2_41_51]|nr:MAG: hypothetical protein A2Y10_16515 [Planctomycetes bacterium GWF2_41_51]HBG27924.1 hypothetical protein [Phycisphaerales bacterium]
MHERTDSIQISQFLIFVTPLVCKILEGTFAIVDIAAEQKGKGLDTIFCLKIHNKEMNFYIGNLLLEIATIDRDETPLRFDGNLTDFDYFLKKLSRAIESKLRILFKLLEHENVDKALEGVAGLSKDYERIRIVKIDNH